MALLLMESFDFIADFSGAGLSGNKWASSNVQINSSAARTGSFGGRAIGGNTTLLESNTYSTDGTFVAGFAMQPVTLGANGGDFLRVREGATIHMALEYNTAGDILIKRDGTTLETVSAALLAANWYYIEFKCTIHDTTGSYELKIDTVSVASDTNVDTQNGGTATWDTVSFHNSISGSERYWDDIYILDGSGAANNDFLGNCRVIARRPSTDAVAAGTHSDFTPSTGADNGAMVDDGTVDGDSTYNTGDTLGQIDTYNYPVLNEGGTIFGVQVLPYYRKTDAGAREAAVVIRSGGTDYNGTTVAPTTTYRYYPEIFEEDPDTSAAWTESGVDNAEFGLEIIS